MTDKGGMFYNMQEVQSNTLYGMIQKMNDAFDVMLNDIGKANEGSFKGLINSATQLLKHWREIAEVGKALATVIALPVKVIWCTYIADKKVMKRSYWKSISIIGVNFLFFFGVLNK